MTGLTPYVKIHETEITAYLRDGYPRPIEPSKKIKDESIIGTNKVLLWSEGRKALGYRTVCTFLPSQYATYDTVAAAFDFEDEERLFYPLDAGRFAVCKFGCSDPLEPDGDAAEGPMKRLQGEVWSEAAELYSATPSSWSPTDEILPITQASGETNGGNIEAGLYSLELTARMAGTALQFDGSDDYVECAADLSGNYLSIELVVFPDAATGLFANGDSYSNTGELYFYFDVDEDIELWVAYVDAVSAHTHKLGTVDALGPCHLVLTYDAVAGAIHCYVDGVESSTPLTGASLPALTSQTVYFGLAYDGVANSYYDGWMGKLKMWQRVLSGSEAEDAYDGSAVSATSLVIDYDFCEGQGDTVYDLSGNGNDGTLINFADTSAGAGDGGSGWLTNVGPVSLALELLSGATVMGSLALSPSLMTAEVLEQDRFGHIYQTYVCDFAATTGRTAFGNGYPWADMKTYAKYIDSEIVLTSLISGRVGEEITITITDTDQASTTVNVSGYDITVDLKTSGGTPVATAQEVIEVINGDTGAGGAGLLVVATLADGEDGSTVLDTQAETALALNVDVTGGALVIEDDREAEYHLLGEWPIVAGGLVVTFTPTLTGTLTGSDVLALEASNDLGASWEEVINSSSGNWTDGEEMEIPVPDIIAAGRTEVWIRFVCPTSATSLSIDDLTIYQERSVSDSEVPKIPAGSTYKVQINGTAGGWGNAATVWRNRYKP